MKQYGAEFFGTFWLVLGGCGSAVLAAGVPELGIGYLGVALAFGLSVLTMAYAIGPISGAHLNPAVSVGLWVGGRFPASQLLPYIVAQVLGGLAAGGVLYLIASGKAGFDLAAGFASNGYGEHSPGGYSLQAALVSEVVLTGMFPADHPRRHLQARAAGLRADRHRPDPDPDPPDQHPGHQHLCEPGAQHRGRPVRRRLGGFPAVAVLGRADSRCGTRRPGLSPDRRQERLNRSA
ncbi:aquaporin Z [Pseudomonas aeruginosa]|nr:aquaporin Z [Pseudomonas aeruginosa]